MPGEIVNNVRNVVVTGSSGFLGRHLMPILVARYGQDNVTGLTSRDYDLMDSRQVRRMLAECKPDVLIHLAGYSGGIGANRARPAEFFYRNILLTALVFEAAAHSGVRKLIYPMGGCSYPAHAVSPIGEDQMWQGYPQKESAGYSVAKSMGLAASIAYRQQYGFNSVVVIPGNMYGEYDNYRENESHVIPALIRRYYEARLAGLEEVTAWGSGKPERDFVYAGDVAAAIPYFIEHFDQSGPVNISSGTRTSIKDLTLLIARLTGFGGRVMWDTSKPDGQMVKIFDVTRLHSLGLSCSTTLEDGLKRTIDWFARHYEARGDGLRL